MIMIIGSLTIELGIPESFSLKDKRHVIKGMQARLRREFNISIAEVAHQDSRQHATLGVVCVSNKKDYAYGLLNRVVNWIEETRLDCVLMDYDIELI